MKTGRYLSHSPLYPCRLRHSRCPMNICSPPGLLRGNWHIIVNIGWMSDCILPTLIWNTFYHFKYSHSLQSLEAFHRYYLTVGRTNQGAVESREMGRGNKQNPWQIKIVGGWICFQSEPDALVLKIFSSRKAFFFFLNPLFNFFFFRRHCCNIIYWCAISYKCHAMLIQTTLLCRKFIFCFCILFDWFSESMLGNKSV